MNLQQFLEEIENIVMIRKGRLTLDSMLDEINWASMAALEFQSMAEEKLDLQLDPAAISLLSQPQAGVVFNAVACEVRSTVLPPASTAQQEGAVVVDGVVQS